MKNLINNMENIEIKHLIKIVKNRLFEAGHEILNDALKKLELQDKKLLSLEDAITALGLMKESMHTDISKKTIEKCIEDLSDFVIKNK